MGRAGGGHEGVFVSGLDRSTSHEERQVAEEEYYLAFSGCPAACLQNFEQDTSLAALSCVD